MDGYHSSIKENVCVHKLGHALRLGHSREATSVMLYMTSSNTSPSTLDKWNLFQAHSLYY